jgi:hypothetical protein
MKRTIKRIHVNQKAIRKNNKILSEQKEEALLPPLSVQTSKGVLKGYERLDILDDSGNTVCSFIYSPNKPLSCGAKLWAETNLEISLV